VVERKIRFNKGDVRGTIKGEVDIITHADFVLIWFGQGSGIPENDKRFKETMAIIFRVD
jgi:hypothetical protein